MSERAASIPAVRCSVEIKRVEGICMVKLVRFKGRPEQKVDTNDSIRQYNMINCTKI